LSGGGDRADVGSKKPPVSVALRLVLCHDERVGTTSASIYRLEEFTSLRSIGNTQRTADRRMELSATGADSSQRFRSTTRLHRAARSLLTMYSASHYDFGFSALLESRTPMMLFTGQFVDRGEC
jgi:hypothetical protein